MKEFSNTNEKLAALAYEDEKQKRILDESVVNFGSSSRGRVRSLVGRRSRMESQKEQKWIKPFERVGFLGDGDSVVGQYISVIYEDNKLVFTFKMKESKLRPVINDEKEEYAWTRDSIVYANKGFRFKLAEGYSLDMDDITIKVADSDSPTRSSRGLVRIEVDLHSNAALHKSFSENSVENLLDRVDKICADVFGVKRSLFDSPERAVERKEKVDRYAWAHKLDVDQFVGAGAINGIDKKLKRKEVAPGYFTMVEEGRDKKIEEITPFALYHTLTSANSPGETIMRILRSGALISTHERFARGITVNGWSSKKDLEVGGGDGAFVRMFAVPAKEIEGMIWKGKQVNIIFDNSILNRTDYYCYLSDRFGATDQGNFDKRVTSEELAMMQTKGHIGMNEIVFNHGISSSDIRFVMVQNIWAKKAIESYLKSRGIENINGRLVDDVVIVAPDPVTLLRKMYDNFDSKKEQRIELEKIAIRKERVKLFTAGDDVVLINTNIKHRSWKRAKLVKINPDLTFTVSTEKESILSVEPDMVGLVNKSKLKVGDMVMHYEEFGFSHTCELVYITDASLSSKKQVKIATFEKPDNVESSPLKDIY
ncbi:MAG: hypothetical protein HY225_01035 [Candidatus Vogelbacteria bacterium]|nr:hypothetical protein [Candidatus Vogelbacteria bacterium]